MAGDCLRTVDSARPDQTAVTPCDHDWRWVRNSYGDAREMRLVADCSGWECWRCGAECDDPEKYEEAEAETMEDEA